MKYIKLFLGVALLSVLSLAGFGAVASAHDFRSGETVVLGKEKIDHTVFAAGNTIDIASEINGDVFCAGQTVTISGVVHGDVLCAGQSVTVTGEVKGDVRLAGQSVNVAGVIDGNATIVSQTFALSTNSEIGGDLSVGANEATINGAIGRDLSTGATTTVVTSTIGRDVKSFGEELRLSSSAQVRGNVEFTSRKDAELASGAAVGGSITRVEPPVDEKKEKKTAFGAALGWVVYWLLALLLTALTLVLLFPKLFQNVTDQAFPQPWKALLVGFVANVVAPVLMIVLLLTLIGAPLAFLILLGWLLVLILSGPVFAYYLGRLTLRGSRQPFVVMLVGAAGLILLYTLPLIGFLTMLAVCWIGSGMILLELFSRTPRPTTPAKKKV